MGQFLTRKSISFGRLYFSASVLCFFFRNLIDAESRLLKQVLLDFIDNARLYLDNDHDREQVLIQALHLHFAKLVATLVSSFPGKQARCRLGAVGNSLMFQSIGDRSCSRTILGRTCSTYSRHGVVDLD